MSTMPVVIASAEGPFARSVGKWFFQIHGERRPRRWVVDDLARRELSKPRRGLGLGRGRAVRRARGSVVGMGAGRLDGGIRMASVVRWRRRWSRTGRDAAPGGLWFGRRRYRPRPCRLGSSTGLGAGARSRSGRGALRHSGHCSTSVLLATGTPVAIEAKIDGGGIRQGSGSMTRDFRWLPGDRGARAAHTRALVHRLGGEAPRPADVASTRRRVSALLSGRNAVVLSEKSCEGEHAGGLDEGRGRSASAPIADLRSVRSAAGDTKVCSMPGSAAFVEKAFARAAEAVEGQRSSDTA